MERQHLAGHSPARSQRSVIIHGGGPQAREVSSENRTQINADERRSKSCKSAKSADFHLCHPFYPMRRFSEEKRGSDFAKYCI
jgi:hypothetical protein